MPINVRVWGRKLHRWGAVLVAIPFLVVIVTGLLLQLKKDVAWVQPPTQKGQGKEPIISFDAILAAAKAVPEAEVRSWADVDRVDVRPKDGIAKVTCKNRWEVQVDFRTGETVQVAYRRSDLIEAIHDGSFFHDAAKLYVFLPAGTVVLGLWVTGMYLWVLPNWVRWSRKSASPKSQVKNTGPET
jgi:uncharacterized iron-regulated membrane protein